MKEYTNQISLEIKKILGSKLLLVFMGILVLLSIATPMLSRLELFRQRYYYGGYEEETLEIDGIVIENDSMLFWEIFQLQDTKNRLNSEATDSNDDLTLELIDIMLKDYLEISQEVKSYDDYRSRVVWGRREHVMNVFILEHMDVEASDMEQILQKSNMYYMDVSSLEKNFYDLSDEEKADKLADSKESLELTHKIIITGDHQAYFDYLLIDAEMTIKGYEQEIERLQQSIVQDPANEDIFNEQIEDMQKSIKNYEIITLPILNYRIENDIIPGSDDWRDTALNYKQNALNELEYNSEIKTQEEFEEDQYLKWDYDSYADYKKAIEERIKDATNRLLIAEKSLETGKPDMEYVQDGTRKKVSNFLWYSLLIAVFATIFAGGLMAREFQSGTIRLLFIRPKSRTKIALSKFFALIVICVAVYAVCILFNLITNGILFGFKDLTYPNYTVSAGVNGISFFAYLVPKILACFVVVLFGASVAYFMSILTRNTALSVSIPLVCFAGSLIAMNIIGYSEKYKWIIYTPLPYMNMPQILTGQYYSPTGVEPIISLGIGMLLGLSLIAVIAGTIILKKRDITN